MVQRYEGASTLFGPWTLAAYQQLYASLAEAMLTNTKIPPGPTPPNLYDRTVHSALMLFYTTQSGSLLCRQFTFQLPVIEDAAPGPFGQVARDVLPAYTRGNSTVVVSFWGANPRNDYRSVLF